ncbi:MAG: AraC family transcriptional regulator [Ketobacteraceae bacterium]|nr:AraC family transcriptional regulator [Ketobacteraceae bacterium]
MDRPSVNISYAKVLVDLLVQRGLNPDDILADTGIDPATLPDADTRISNQQFLRLVENGLALSGDPNLGVWFGLQLKISAHGYLGYAALSSATLGEAIQMAVKYAATRLGLVKVSYFESDDFGVIQADCTVPLKEETERFVLQTFFTSFGVMGENLVGEVPDQVEVLCSYSDVPDPELADRFNGQLPRFNQPVNQIRLPVSFLQTPLGMSDPVSHQLMEAQCRKELETIGTGSDLLLKVRRIVSAEPGRFPKLEEVAEQCFMSSRTFKRRLADLGTSYQELVDHERRKKAMEYLSHTSKTVDEIALLLGYNDPSNFGRAFKRWLGTTPTQYRNQKSSANNN